VRIFASAARRLPCALRIQRHIRAGAARSQRAADIARRTPRLRVRNSRAARAALRSNISAAGFDRAVDIAVRISLLFIAWLCVAQRTMHLRMRRAPRIADDIGSRRFTAAHRRKARRQGISENRHQRKAASRKYRASISADARKSGSYSGEKQAVKAKAAIIEKLVSTAKKIGGGGIDPAAA